MRVRVYSPGDTVTLYLNGELVDTKTLTVDDKLIATFTVPYTPGRLTAVALRDGNSIGHTTLETAGPPAALRLAPEFSFLTADPDEVGYVLIEVVDESGRLVPDAVVDVRVDVKGSGTLTAIANANPRNLASYTAGRRFTYRVLRSRSSDRHSRTARWRFEHKLPGSAATRLLFRW